MSDNEVRYLLTSTLPGDRRVGVSIATAPPGADQPVVLNSDIAEWFSSKNITEDGPIKLTVGGYRFTTVRDGVVIATNDPENSRDWFLFPTLDKSVYYISADSDGKEIWTASRDGQPIKITTFTPGDERGYLFRFIPLLK